MDLVTTAYGRPALEALARIVARAKAGEPLAPVTVVVPSNHVGVTARRGLATGRFGPITARGTGIVGVTFLTPYRLAELLGSPRLAAAGRRPVSTPVVAAALRQALRAGPGVFGPVADHPATEEALVAAFGELADISTAGLDRLAAQGPRASDVVRLCRQARTLLAASWYDEADLVGAARRALDAGAGGVGGGVGGGGGAELGHVAVHLPQDLTRRAAALLRSVAERSPTTVLAGLVGDSRADTGVLRSLSRLGIDEVAGVMVADDELGGSGWPVDAASTRVVTTSDADDEVRTAVRVVLDAAREGTPLEQIAVLFSAEQPYARLVHEHMAAAGVASNGTAPRGLRSWALGRVLLGILDWRDHGYRRRDLLGLLVNLPPGATDLPGPPPVAAWERLSRDAAVVAGRAHWDLRLAQLAGELDRRADLAAQDVLLEAGSPVAARDEDDEPATTELRLFELPEPDAVAPAERKEPTDAARLRRRAAAARALRSLALGLIDELDAAAANPTPWRDRVAWLRRLSARLVGGMAAREQWPPDERRAAERVERALDRLAGLDDLDGPASLDVFRRTLQIEFDADLGRVGRFGEGVLVAPLSFGIGLDLDLAIVLGMAEGLLPSRPSDDSLLPDAERRATGGELPLRREHVERQHRQLRATLAAARRRVLCAPRGDLRASHEHVLSRWLTEIAEGGGIPVEAVPSFAFGVSHVANPATEQEYRLRVPPVLRLDPVVAAGREMTAARLSDRFTRFDGNLGGQPVRSPLDDVVSATRLESWAVCPHAYFMRQVLRVEPAEDPAETLWISPLERGSLVHEALERFLQAVLTRDPAQQPGPDRPWTDDDHKLLAGITEAVCAEYEARGVVGRTLFWHRDRARIQIRLDRFLDEDTEQRRANRSRPVAAELAFGLPGAAVDAVEVPIGGATGPDHQGQAGTSSEAERPGTRALRFRGAADRIDITEDGTLRVIDYKTGRPGDYRLLSEDNPDDRGTHLQLPVYGLAARALRQSPDAPIAAEYWFVNDSAGLATIGYRVTDEVLARVGTTLATIVDGIESGVFPARPTASSSDPFIRCPYCDPDGLGVTDRRRAWERKRDDPGLAPYANLAEPQKEDEP